MLPDLWRSIEPGSGVVSAFAEALRALIKHNISEDAWRTVARQSTFVQVNIATGGFPRFSPQFFCDTNLLGRVLEGVCGRYTCEYHVVEGKYHCALSVAAIGGIKPAQGLGVELGSGVGPTRAAAWADAAHTVLKRDFFHILRSRELWKQFSDLAGNPKTMVSIGAPLGVDVPACAEPDEFKGLVISASTGSTFCCARGRTPSEATDEAMRSFFKLCSNSRSPSHHHEIFSWDEQTNFQRSFVHALLGALSRSLGGRARLALDDGSIVVATHSHVLTSFRFESVVSSVFMLTSLCQTYCSKETLHAAAEVIRYIDLCEHRDRTRRCSHQRICQNICFRIVGVPPIFSLCFNGDGWDASLQVEFPPKSETKVRIASATAQTKTAAVEKLLSKIDGYSMSIKRHIESVFFET